jgi:HK97 family phage major capsid protein
MFRLTKDDTNMKFKRTFSITRDGTIDVTARTVPLAFSSEEPYERWFGIEILDHSNGSCDLSRLADGRHPLLLNHEIENQIGVIDSAVIDPDKLGRAIVRFGRGPLASEIFQDVQDGIRSLVSVGYMIDELEADDGEGEDRKLRKFTWGEFEARQKEIHGADYMNRAASNTKRAAGDTDPIFRVTSWTPFEISIVSVPADATVGVGRSAAAGAVVEPSQEEPATQLVATPEPIILTERNVAMNAENEGLKAEQKRTADLLALAETYAKYDGQKLVGEFIKSGKSVVEFQNAIMEKITSRHTDTRELNIGLTDGEVKQYSLARAILAAAKGDWKEAGLEKSASDAIAKRTGMDPEGFFVPSEAIRSMSASRAFDAGTAGNGGNLIQTSVLGGEFVDVLRNALVLSKMGISVLGGLTSNIAIPRKTAPTTIQNATELAVFTDGNPTTTQILFSPKRVGGTIPYSKQALIQSSLSVDQMLYNDLAMGIAVQIDAFGLIGTGTAPQPRGLINQAGIGAVVGGTNGAQIAWSHIVGLESACANVNAEPDQLAGYVVNTRTRGWSKTTSKIATGNFMPLWSDSSPTPLNSYKAGVTNNMPFNGTKGTAAGITSTLAFSSDWSALVLALFGGLDIVVDPYTLASAGQYRLTANQFIDFGVRNPACFAAMTDALTA